MEKLAKGYGALDVDAARYTGTMPDRSRESKPGTEAKIIERPILKDMKET